MKYFILPFGCQMNRSDAERIRTVLDEMGYGEAESEDDPAIAIKGIISCSVRQKGIDRVYGRIRKWNAEKSERSFLSFVSGCVLPADKEKFLKLFDLVFSIDQLPQLPDMIRQYGVPTPGSMTSGGIVPDRNTAPGSSGNAVVGTPGAPQISAGAAAVSHPAISPTGISISIDAAVGAPDIGSPHRAAAQRRIEEFWKVQPSYSSSVEAYVPIQNGCDKFCTFCAVPYTRGREVSRPSADILREVRTLVEGGCKSITLLGQNVNSYGLDKTGSELSFPRLMKAVGEIGRETGAEFLTYFTSPHPRDMVPELLEVIAEYDVLAKWLHLPLQSGDDKVLLRMNRNYSMDRYRTVVADIRRILPGAALFTDIIVGFTGETEEQFEATATAMREFKYDMAYIAQYSPRPGARSERWDDDVPGEEKLRRFHALGDILQECAAPGNSARVGQAERVLITSADRKKGYLSGYTEGRIPVRVADDGVEIGSFVDLQIVAARPLSLEGRALKLGAVV